MKDIEVFKIDLETAINGMLAEADRISTLFSSLSSAQLNWKPNADVWSIGQCLDHLIVTHSRYAVRFTELIEKQGMGFWHKISPFSAMFGNAILKSVIAENIKKTKTFKILEPSQSDIRPDIVREYKFQLHGFIHKLQQLQRFDSRNTVISSTVSNLITYSLHDAFSIIYHHDIRHINQAQRILEHLDFPSA